MSEESLRSVSVTRVKKGVYEARNPQGVTLTFGNEPGLFSSVELLLTAIAGCSGTDVDFITSKRAEPSSFELHVSGHKIRDEKGNNRVDDITLRFDISFPEGEEGDAARAVLERAVQQSHDRLCSVSRTVELGTPIAVEIAGQD